MGFAMTVLSFSMLGRLAGIHRVSCGPADLDPVNVWQSIDDHAHRAWARAVKHYENLRLVYEIQTSLRDWTNRKSRRRRAAQGTQPAANSPDLAEPARAREAQIGAET